jgi:hypothetical protein
VGVRVTIRRVGSPGCPLVSTCQGGSGGIGGQPPVILRSLYSAESGRIVPSLNASDAMSAKRSQRREYRFSMKAR